MKIDEAVKIINSQPAEEVAAHYAVSRSSSFDSLDEKGVSDYLAFMKESGAVFDLDKAYSRVIDLFKQWSTEQ